MNYAAHTSHGSPGRTIGLLGGSFNPAHKGHVHLSEQACRRLGLDEVWWLVSPGNPLKSRSGMAPYEERFASAQETVRAHPYIRVSDIERRMATCYTIDTLLALRKRFPHLRFVWLMGADNLHQFHRWRRWQDIFSTMPVAVFDRAPYSHAALRSKTALRFAKFRRFGRQLPVLSGLMLPAWWFIHMPRHPESSTALRALE